MKCFGMASHSLHSLFVLEEKSKSPPSIIPLSHLFNVNKGLENFQLDFNFFSLKGHFSCLLNYVRLNLVLHSYFISRHGIHTFFSFKLFLLGGYSLVPSTRDTPRVSSLLYTG